MKEQIIVTVDGNGRLSPFLEAEQFVLYRKTGGEWVQSDIISAGTPTLQAGSIRSLVSELLTRFADCRIILSGEVKGIAYQVLNRHGYHIFESDGIDGFDGIVLEIEAAQAEARDNDSVRLEPHSPNNDGQYFLNLIELQRIHPEISSKKALRPFMEDRVFLEMELVCQHLPPWMADVMAKRGLCCRMESLGDHECRAVISKEPCR